PSLFTATPFDPARLERPVPAKDPLKRILDRPEYYAGQVLVPFGMYHLERSPADRPKGPRRIRVVEQSIERKEHRGPLELISHATTDLEVEPKLAESLGRLSRDELKGLALLTVWVTTGGNCGLVKAEILQSYKTRVKKVGYALQGDIEYAT